MPDGPANPAPRPLDPQRALDADPLAAKLLDAQGGHAAAVAHIRARDPRARLEQASAQLHGAQGLPPPELREAREEPDAPSSRRGRVG